MLCPVIGAAESKAGAWELVANENGVTVYSRPIKDSDLLEYQAITVINQRMDAICEVFSDLEAFPKWMPNCDRISMVKNIDYDNDKDLKNNYKIMYIITDMPFPLSDRDILAKTIIDVDESSGNLVIDIVGVKELLVPVKQDVVRMTDLKARYIVEYIEEEKTRLYYILSSDPAGSVPHFVVNLAAYKNPMDTLIKLREVAKNPKYRDVIKNRKENAYHRAISKKIEEGIKNRKKK